ncbi:hypothetical protein PVNG_06466 [Plasmodium vivax North Korean]|uniref:Uncharacterized protein n=1 Tax=Plasmodium vivax North Korean TaxID=1035514 RepID=A0A0J9TNT1_PLAVI|nr:hypothetical protein PVNG_06466 [Plasmodium vivax North Korean]
MLDMKSIQPNLNKNDYIISNLYRLFSSTPPFYSDITTNYCKYINMWLNEKYREKHYYINGPYFDVFKTFIIKLNRVKFGNKQKPCEKYINHLDPDRFNKVKLLYDLYDAYNKINKFYKNKSKDTCGDIVALDKNYRDSIYDYYVNDKILFDKLEHIKELILGIKKNYLSPCTYSLFFSTPQKLIDLREKEAQEAKEEQLRKQNETERREREEQLRNGNAEMEQQPEQPFRKRQDHQQGTYFGENIYQKDNLNIKRRKMNY